MNKTRDILENATNDLMRNLVQVNPDICPDCESMTHLEVETREGGYNEMVRYCYGCGSTQTA